MANVVTLTPEELIRLETEHLAWAESRPDVVRDLALRFRPWKLYRMKSTGHRVLLYSINENRTATVDVLGKYNIVSMERRVFGVDPDDLEECDLPKEGEPVGVYLTEEEQRLMVNRRRAEFGLPPLDMAEFKNIGNTGGGYCMVDGKPAGEQVDRDVPPPKEIMKS